jgi:hypothetical protein
MDCENDFFESDCDSSIKLDESYIPSIEAVKTSISTPTDIFDLNLLPVDMFDLNSLCDHPGICLIGKRQSGREEIIKKLVVNLYNQKKIDECIIISPAEKHTPFYSDIVDKIYFNYSDKIFEEILEIQCERAEESKRTGTAYKRVMVVLDDCLSEKGSWRFSQPFWELVFNHRHYQISFAIGVQFPFGFTPMFRASFDYIFLLAEDFVSNQKRMYKHYAGMFPSFISFRQKLSNLTDNYGSMVILNRGGKTTFSEKIFWYNAKYETCVATKMPVTHLIKYDYLLKNSETVKQSGDVKMDELETLLLNIAKYNDDVINVISSKTMNYNKFKILETISKSNDAIFKYISAII